MASANTLFKSHEDYRRNKELEEARKAGIAPAAVDEEGREINPHIPQYMSSAPWYLNSTQPTLKHQKDWRAALKDDRKYYDRGVKTFQAKTYRKGACENCGAMSHKTKDCVERPRKTGAKWTKTEIAADEKIQDLNLETFDAKKDRWNGYDTSDYAKIVDIYEKAEKVKHEIKRKAALEKLEKGEHLGGSDDDDDRDDDKIAETEEAGFDKLEKRVRTTGGGASGTVRNLRIREDTAKYLYNLDPNSAHYDPKSRSMRADPQPHKPANEKAFLGDNFTRQTGDFYGLQALTVHSVNAQKGGGEFHPQAAPSQAEALHRQFKAKKEQLEKQGKSSVMETYGNAAKIPDSDEARLLLGQTEHYVEYNAAGRVIKGQEAKARSRYEEDVYPGNHTSVWGSFWRDGEWGFACCHQMVRNSYCTGSAGEQAAADSLANEQRNMEAKAARLPPPPASDAPQSKAAGWGTDVSGDVQLDPSKLKAALKEQDEMNQGELDDRKRKYNSISGNDAVTEEEMEAYRLRKARADDPLAQSSLAGNNSGYDFV